MELQRSENDQQLFAQIKKVGEVSRVFWDNEKNQIQIRFKPELKDDTEAQERAKKKVNTIRLNFQKGIMAFDDNLSASELVQLAADDEPTTVPLRPIVNGDAVEPKSQVYRMVDVDDDAPVPWNPPRKKKKKD